jgi:hypothetical protein
MLMEAEEDWDKWYGLLLTWRRATAKSFRKECSVEAAVEALMLKLPKATSQHPFHH